MSKVIGINKVFTLPAEKRPFWARVIVNNPKALLGD